MDHLFERLEGLAGEAAPRWRGRIEAIDGRRMIIAGLSSIAAVGDRLFIDRQGMDTLLAEIIGCEGPQAIAMAFGATVGLSVGDAALLERHASFAAPSRKWLGEILDWQARRADGESPGDGDTRLPLLAPPPRAALRRRLGERLTTGHCAFDTFVPICRGQRLGLFAGSGVGKSMLLGSLARTIDADVVIAALIGERGREVNAFVEESLTADARGRAVVIASTSDEPALVKRQSAQLAMTTAEYFRNEGLHVLLIFDSLTRYAEAHREIALAGGEPPSLRAFPPSTFQAIASLVERAGPGVAGQGDITAVFSVLVAGSDMDEPVADAVRGYLDGHIVLDRTIAERGRFPAIDIRRSVSRSLPRAASDAENALLAAGRSLLGAYEDAELIVRAGLYKAGVDPMIDKAVRIWPALDRFFAGSEPAGPEASFDRLRAILEEEDHSSASGA